MVLHFTWQIMQFIYNLKSTDGAHICNLSAASVLEKRFGFGAPVLLFSADFSAGAGED